MHHAVPVNSVAGAVAGLTTELVVQIQDVKLMIRDNLQSTSACYSDLPHLNRPAVFSSHLLINNSNYPR